MWVLIAVQIILSIALLLALFVTAAWLRSHSRGEREIQLLLERLTTAYHQMRGATVAPPPVRAPRVGKAPAPLRLDALTDSRRAAGLTIAMELPVFPERAEPGLTGEDRAQSRTRPEEVAPSCQRAEQLGEAPAELDPDTAAAIDALQRYVDAGREDGTMLNRLIDAGFAVVGEAPGESGDHAVASDDIAPMTPATPTKPTGI